MHIQTSPLKTYPLTNSARVGLPAPTPSQTPFATVDQFQLSPGLEATSSSPINCGCDPLSAALGALAFFGGTMALEMAKEIAKRTGRALIDIACEMLADLRKVEKKESQSSAVPLRDQNPGITALGNSHAPRLLVTLSE